MIQNYKCNEIKIKCSKFSHTIDATFLKICSALSHAFIAKCFRSEISLDQLGQDMQNKTKQNLDAFNLLYRQCQA